MKSKLFMFCTGGLLAALCGCTSVKVESGSDTYVDPRGSMEAETQIVRSSIPVSVRDVSVPSDGFTADVVELTKGRLAANGYAVNEAVAYVKINLNTHVEPFDKMGNYHVYEGQCGIQVLRADGKVLANELLSVKSDRVLEAERALIDARRKIAAKAAEVATQVCSEKTTGMESRIIVMKKVSDRKAADVAKFIRKEAGVYSCNRIPGQTDGIQYRVIYNAKAFPDGINVMVKRASKS